MPNKLPLPTAFLEKYKSTLHTCNICPRACGVDRHIKTGDCGEPFLPKIASANLHTGEEPPISGNNGSGTIFFSGCNMHCVFCQNYPISQLHQANKKYTIDELGDLMLSLQKRKAHNINFVSPSHYLYQMVMAIKTAIQKGFNLPIVYNSSGYDKADVICDLANIVDVYLPDAKYANNILAKKFSGASNYVENNRATLKEMFTQKGADIQLDDNGIIQNGLIIRHLVLPNEVQNSKDVLHRIATELSPKIHLSLMSQYFPAHLAKTDEQFTSINRGITADEYNEVADFADSLGFDNGWFQPTMSASM
jgi:putative pyruvate formate lyase activating enzyme